MIRFVRAFAWFRWRTLMNGIRGGRRRDAMERLSRIAGIVVPVLVYLIFLGFALGIGALALFGGWAAGTGAVEPRPVFLGVRAILLVVTMIVLLVPLGRTMHGVSTAQSRFLLLPVTRRSLHDVEVAAGLLDPWVAFVLPGLLLFPIGLIAAGRLSAGVVILLLDVTFAMTLACLGSTLTFGLQWFLRDRRRAEFGAILLVLVFSSAGALTVLFSGDVEIRVSLRDLEERFPVATRLVPSEIHGRAARRAMEQGALHALPGAAGLCLEALVLYLLSARIHRVTLDSPEVNRSRGRGGVARRGPPRLPWVSEATAAVAWIQLHAAIRTVRGKLGVFLPGPMIVLMSLMFGRLSQEVPFAHMLTGRGSIVLSFGVLVTLISLQPILLNQFASERAGMTALILAPVSDVEIVRGKAIGGGLLAGLGIALCLTLTFIAFPGGSFFDWGTTLLGGLSAYVLLSPVAALLSALLPRSSDINTVGSKGNAHGVASLLGTLATFALMGPPGLILGLGVLTEPWIGFLLMVLYATVAVAVTPFLLGLASRVVADRRENLALVATSR